MTRRSEACEETSAHTESHQIRARQQKRYTDIHGLGARFFLHVIKTPAVSSVYKRGPGEETQNKQGGTAADLGDM